MTDMPTYKIKLLDEAYYRANKDRVDSIMVRLHRALGIALMCHPGHESEARKHFSASRRYGRPAYGFWLMTFLPSIFRRVIMKLRELIH